MEKYRDQKLLDPELKISVARTAEEVKSFRKIFEAMHPGPLAGIDYLLTSAEFMQRAIRPYVIAVFRHGRPETMLVGLLNNIKREIKFKGRVILRAKARILGVVCGGIIGNLNVANCAALILELNQLLKRNEADAIYFQEIPIDSQIYQLGRIIPSLMFRDHSLQVENHYKMNLFSSADDFYGSKSSKQRYNLRRPIKKLDKLFAGRIMIKCFRAAHEIPQFCREAEQITLKSWQFKTKGKFTNDFPTRKLLSLLAKRNQLLGYILYIENIPCAYQYGIIYNNTYHLEYLGYDTRFEKYGVGTVILIKVIEILCDDTDFEFYDFGWMNADYKERFADQSWKEANFYLFQPTLKGAVMNAIKLLSTKLPEIKMKWQQKKDR